MRRLNKNKKKTKNLSTLVKPKFQKDINCNECSCEVMLYFKVDIGELHQ